ncbi:uncharacterized protein EI90DRAFT_3085020 [Cantharellus anzutake]|uniref:uncharacterized protein n=1 Tax=Cantharellus anzutake TaxID=1750568 RepID=UPI001908A2A2|nr:uncharacterized protein EI90DRAFT_3085020 [Cantharellus anzutake]KAF8317794.1 hypothetical protein EI90DRAFT_3085020 [Cantharellus anzutake]
MPSRQRSLAQLLRMHAEKGSGEELMNITPEEERRLKEALDQWVNSSDDDASFSRDDRSGSSEDEDASGVGVPVRQTSSRSDHINGDCTTMNVDADSPASSGGELRTPVA